MKDNIPEIVISGNKDVKDYLSIIFRLGKYHDQILIKFKDNYIDMIDGMLFGLRKSFGWLQEGDIEKVQDENKKCKYFNDDIISKEGERLKRGPNYRKCFNKESGYEECSFQVMKACGKYEQKSKSKILINKVVIRKHGAIIGI